jgi:tetratricopeptide (TPR) repeat protein
MKYILSCAALFVGFVGFAQNSEEFAAKAKIEFENDNLKESLKLYGKAISIDTSKSDYYCERGQVYVQLNKFQEALLDFNKSIVLDNKNVDAFHNRAILYYSSQYPDYAILDNNEALKYVKNDTLKYILFNNRGNAKAMKRDFQGAYEDYLKVLDFDSTDIDALTNMGAILDDLGKDQEAIMYLERAIRVQPDFIGGYGNLAFRYIKLGDFEKALSLNNKVISMDPESALAFNNRGFVYYKMGDYKNALIDVNKSLKMYPFNSYAFKNRALIYIAQKKKKASCNDIAKAIELGFTKMYGPEVEDLQKEHCK